MIKIVLGVLLILSTTLIGFKLSERKKFKKNVYEQLLFFCNKLKSEVGYKTNTIDKYVEELPDELKVNLNLSPNSFIDGKPVEITDKRLSNDEKKEIAEFFSELGKYDMEGFVNMIDFYLEKFGKKFNEAEKIYEKSKSFYIKMGALSGTLLYVIII